MRDYRIKIVLIAFSALAFKHVSAGPVFQPPGSNLVFGDVTHGLRIQSASGNPAAGAAEHARSDGQSRRGTIVTAAGGIEYGNVQELFDFYDWISGGYRPSPPGTTPGPGQKPGDRPDPGIDIGKILDEINPDIRATINAVAAELATHAALLGIMSTEGYGKAWVAADAPFVLGSGFLDGTWTAGLSWSGTSKVFGLAQPVEFDIDQAIANLQDWIDQNIGNLVGEVPLSDDVAIRTDPTTRNTVVILDTDSSLLTKASQSTELSVAYSRPAWATNAGSLFLGLEAKYYFMRLSRFSARLGDITDSETLFEAIDNQRFNDEGGVGIDVGALWVGSNFQLGAQWTNINEPTFNYPEVDITPYSDSRIIDFLQRDKRYKMDDQVKVEASYSSTGKRWSVHLGYDVDAVTDPLGDRFQWVTLSAALARDSFWLPNVRIGYRQNLAGTELGYIGVGVTAFKYLNVDLSSALDTVKIKGTELPQGLMGSIGFQINW